MGKALSVEVGESLLVAAYQMASSYGRRKKIKTETHQGLVTTSYKRQRLATITGIVFLAQLESNDGVSVIEFILRDSDLEDMAEQEEILAVTDTEISIRPSPLRKVRKIWKLN